MIIVGHAKDKGAVYVGRGSPLGNPFVLTNESLRNEVITRYKQWLNFHIQEDIQTTSIMNELERLYKLSLKGDLILGCPGNCHPRPCHADYIKEVLEYNTLIRS